jgi:cell division protein FtsI (penicillin-binding protein 3)
VSHDIEVTAPRVNAKPEPTIAEDDAHEQGDVNAMFAAINDLPIDDPLRAEPAQTTATTEPAAQPATQAANKVMNTAAKAVSAASHDVSGPDQTPGPQEAAKASNEVTISDAKKLKVPSLVGLPMRQVIVHAAAAGLEVQISGSGTVREQAPAAGTLVASGTQIVVRCAR